MRAMGDQSRTVGLTANQPTWLVPWTVVLQCKISYPNHRDVELNPNHTTIPDIRYGIPDISRGRSFDTSNNDVGNDLNFV